MAADTPSTPLGALPVDFASGAETRILRLFARFVSAGYLFYLILLAPAIGDQTRAMAAWWTPFGVVAVFIPPLAMGAATFGRDLRWVRLFAGVTALSYVVAAATWPIAWNGVLLQSDSWISSIPGLSGLAAAVAWGPRRTISQLVVAITIVQLINHACRVPNHNGAFVPDLAFAMSFCLLFVAAALMAMRTGRLLDETQSGAHAVAAAAAAIEARAVQRVRFNALVHDWVMSTLLAAARQPHTDVVRNQARLTLSKLDELGDVEQGSFDARAVLAHLRTAVGAVDDSLRVDTRVDPGAEKATYPAEAIRVVGGAVSEAVRNSVLHAGDRARRSVSVTVGAMGLEAVIADTGTGFDIEAVAPHRLGLAVSIRGRMQQLDGGSVDVQSCLGAGTTIKMVWVAQP
ncbi:ATP-binding protein [Antrihabitans stalactiti]|uniref:ATP-binding protein n=1 Tax=Antrihabitans stalactiti TaxID=2584121 RepID=A0A848K8E8_9NOCA|nr:ATP-binding protein [Antrihabitans stalactiti]NMN95083.1 ATP-binding protein [Antrihabitans stalactiti]